MYSKKLKEVFYVREKRKIYIVSLYQKYPEFKLTYI